MHSLFSEREKSGGFTLVELLVSVAVLAALLAILLSITNSVSKAVITTSAKIDTFAASRAAFDLMSQKLSQATLNTYWDYDDPIQPTVYLRQSDLEFYVRQNVQNSGYGQEIYFQVPANYTTKPEIRATDGLLNACGYYIEYGPSSGTFQPSILPNTVNRYRYRLVQGLEPTENLGVYGSASSTTLQWPATPGSVGAVATTWTGANGYWIKYWAPFWTNHYWISTISNSGTATSGALNTNVAPLADNVIALVIWPRLPVADDPQGIKLAQTPTAAGATYLYDSQYNTFPTTGTQPLWANQQPPMVHITLIVISEASAARLDTKSTTPPSAITTALGTNSSTGTGVFINPVNYQSDIAYVSAQLAKNQIDFRVLDTSVIMRESKWSDNSQ